MLIGAMQSDDVPDFMSSGEKSLDWTPKSFKYLKVLGKGSFGKVMYSLTWA